ncbi:hypothetical protein CAPTEDRAFT_153249 [Capitella teleta]|uniref:Palmitoyltransferase n=1 Tax=Capitella teleta TaxID=283909 RepID=R7UXN2_CAPTE|nr:hypothetical protein CAPTEDRAFT_153249 [Capitella teleta]|eukprot:ELU11089.1 hypothetical protein CAPTEDRAFT_153249 [Capitella teleta]
MTPKQMEIAGVAFFWFLSGSMVISALWIMLPHLTKNTDSCTTKVCMVVSVAFVYAQSIMNWYLCSRKTPSKALSTTEGDDHVGWTYCALCMLQAPPRSYHCRICNLCVLKREHHCYFTASCIGFFNQRYFIILVFYLSLGCGYFMSLVLQYYISTGAPWSAFVLPIASYQYLSNMLPTGTFLLLVQFNIVAMIGSVCMAYFAWQMVVVYRGQTSYEATRGITRYRADPTANFTSVFGAWWLLNFLFPTSFAQEGDGSHWKTAKNIKGN